MTIAIQLDNGVVKYKSDLDQSYLLCDFASAQQKFPEFTFSAGSDKRGIYLRVYAHQEVKIPFHLYFQHTEDCAVHFHIHLEENSSLVLLEEHACDVALHAEIKTHVEVKTGARLYYHKIQNQNESASHESTVSFIQEGDSLVETYLLSAGSGSAIENCFVQLNGAGATHSAHGLYIKRNQQKFSKSIFVEHNAPHAKSHIAFKGILNDKAHAQFNGKIKVDNKAQKTVSQQANHNLVLSKDAVIKTEPQFEIYADDVKCAHGAAVGALDKEALFFLQSRGLSCEQATQILIEGFADSVFLNIKNEEIAACFKKYIKQSLTPC